MSNATFPIALPTDHAAINWETNILTAAEAAQLLQVPKTTVYKLAHRGIISATKIGRHWRFLRSQLYLWMRAHTMEKSLLYKSC